MFDIMKLELPVYSPEHIAGGAPVDCGATAFIDQVLAQRLIQIAASVIGTGAESSRVENTAPFKWHVETLFEDGVLLAEGCDYDVLKVDLAIGVYIRIGKAGFCFASDVPGTGTFLTQQIDFLQLANQFGIKLPWICEPEKENLDPEEVFCLVTDIVEACTDALLDEAAMYKDLLHSLMSGADPETLRKVLKEVVDADGAPLNFEEQEGLKETLLQLAQAVA